MTDAYGTHADLEPLREAARLSPGNLPLRRLLAGRLLAAGLVGEAEAEFRAALALEPATPDLILGLAEAYLRQGKHGAALLALDGLPEPLPAGSLLKARALHGEGDLKGAFAWYQEAVGADPSLADDSFASSLRDRPAPIVAEEAAPSAHGQVTFADVAGMDDVKEALHMKLLLPHRQPELFAAFGKRAGGGVLLYGPPGCGKTHLARATAGELGAKFINVGLADILDMWVGSSERNLAATFELARRQKPCVLFFDEVDALAARRSDMRGAHNRHVVNQFLAEMDGVDDGANDGVLILAATNAPWYMDPAFRRPGRFDETIFVPPPDAAARAEILALLCRDKPVTEVDYARLAKATEGFVGADLKGVVDRAVEGRLRESIKVGRMVPLSTKDLASAAKSQRPTATREWLATARNYVLHANESGAWDDLLPYFKGIK